MKTNKSYTKRIKQTRGGKLVARTPGQNHFNAKASGEESLRKKRSQSFDLSNKQEGQYFGSAK